MVEVIVEGIYKLPMLKPLHDMENFGIITSGSLPWPSKFVTYNMLMFQSGKLSTGDSLDMSPQDEASIVANDATVKDMEVKLNPSLITWGWIISVLQWTELMD